ncbi:uncharacterized protein [Aegilops tauschii subsp. strangulata]|uniref:uncharacterized protein n=1 Tax=Aegilops tauschii subsp. strangulata TaxID=200361 RepID=UPI001ABD042E
MILSPIQSIIAHHSRSCSVSLFLSQDRASATKSSPLGIPHFSRTKLGAVFLLNSAPDGFVIDQRGGKGNVLAVFIPMTVPFAFVQVYPALAFLPSRRWIDIDSSISRFAIQRWSLQNTLIYRPMACGLNSCVDAQLGKSV